MRGRTKEPRLGRHNPEGGIMEDTVEFFNLVLELKLDAHEKDALVAFLRQL